MSMVLYVDVSAPECYLAVRRAAVLAAAGVPVDVRAVEQEPRLPVPGRRLAEADRDALSARFGALEALLLPGEELPWSMPPLTPRTQAAVSAVAQTYGTPAAGDVRRVLFDLYWREGADVGSPEVLRTPLAGPVLRAGSACDPLLQCGYVVTMDRAPISTAAWRRVRDWRGEWQDLGAPALPVLLAGGATLHGVDALRRLGKEITYAAADVTAPADEPRRYPPAGVRPPAGWVSEIGGPWRHTYRPPAAGPASSTP